MAYDKVVDSSVLDANLTAIADAIREKAGVEDTFAFPAGFVEAIAAIESGGGGMKVAYGKVIPAEDLYICEIVHSLGVIPNFALIFGDYSFSKAVNQSLTTIAYGEEDYGGNVRMSFSNVRSTTTSSSGVRANKAAQGTEEYSNNLAWTPNSSTTQAYNSIGGLFYGADTSKIYYGHPTLQQYFMKNTVPYYYLIGYLDGFYMPYE